MAALVIWLLTWQRPIVCGGIPGAYQPAVAEKEDVRAAAQFAVVEQEKRQGVALHLNAIVDAKKQIVAGTNYKLMLSVSRDGRAMVANVTVYRGLDSKYELKAWRWEQSSGELGAGKSELRTKGGIFSILKNWFPN